MDLIGPTSPAFIFTLVGLACLAVMLAVSLLGNVPINNQVIAWNSQSPPANWLELRTRWNRLHVVRVVLDIAALTFILLGLLSHKNEC